jgi:hypothetical protein
VYATDVQHPLAGAIDSYVALHDENRPGVKRRAEAAALEGLSDAARKKAVDKRNREAKEAERARKAALEKARAVHSGKKNAGRFDEARARLLVCLLLSAACSGALRHERDVRNRTPREPNVVRLGLAERREAGDRLAC